MLSDRIWCKHDCASLAVRTQQATKHDASCLGGLLVPQVSGNSISYVLRKYTPKPAIVVYFCPERFLRNRLPRAGFLCWYGFTVEGTRSVRAFLRGYLISECSYVSGYAAEFNGADLLGDSLNTMVVVVIQHRLGAFGAASDSESRQRI